MIRFLIPALAALLALGCASGERTTNGDPVRLTGQEDQATPVRGVLRDDLLAASAPGGRKDFPDRRKPLTVVSSLVLDSHGGSRALAITFRSLAGQRCLAFLIYDQQNPAEPPICSTPCRKRLCTEQLIGFDPPARVLVGTVAPNVDQIELLTPSGALRRYRVTGRSVGRPPRRPFLVEITGLREVRALSRGRVVGSEGYIR